LRLDPEYDDHLRATVVIPAAAALACLGGAVVIGAVFGACPAII
jgi:hypothetical protein